MGAAAAAALSLALRAGPSPKTAGGGTLARFARGYLGAREASVCFGCTTADRAPPGFGRNTGCSPRRRTSCGCCSEFIRPVDTEASFVFPSPRHPSPVHHQHVPVHVVRGGRGQEDDGAGEILGLAPARGGDAGGDLGGA